LPTLVITSDADPVLEIIEEATGELIWARRLAARTIQPGVFAPGKYVLRLSVPERGATLEQRGVVASAGNDARLEIRI